MSERAQIIQKLRNSGASDKTVLAAKAKLAVK